MRALDRKLLRDLRRIWAQGLAIALVLACGLMVLVMADGTLRSLDETLRAYYERQRFADVFASATRVPDDIAPLIAGLDGVAQAETRIVGSAILDLPGMMEPASAKVISLPASGQPKLNLPLLRAGRLPDPLRPDEVLLMEPFAEANALPPGAGFDITLNGQRRTLTVTGHVLSPEFVYSIGPGSIMPDDRHFGIIWMNEASLAAATDLGGAFNDVTVALRREADPRKVIAALDHLLAPYGGTGAHARDRQTSHMFLNSEMEELGTIAISMPPIFLIVSAFLVNMVLGRLIRLERAQIGLLKAVGYSAREIGWHYLKLSIGIGVGGVLLGVASGWWAGHAMTQMYTEFFRFPWLIYVPGVRAIAWAVVLGLATVIIGALRAVAATVSLPPATAMSPPSPPVFRRGWIDSFGRVARLRQTSMMIARSILRWPGRAAITFFGVAASVAVLVSCFFIFDTMDLLMDEMFVQSNRQDVTLVLNQNKGLRAESDAATLPGVRRVEGGFALPVRLIHGASERLSTLQARGQGTELTQLLNEDGRVVSIPESGLVLPERLAERLGVTVGSQMQVALLAPPRETWTLSVSAVIRQSLGDEVHMSKEALFRLMRQDAQVNQLNLSVDPLALPRLMETAKATPVIAGLIYWPDVKGQIDATINESLRIMTVIFSTLGMLITLGVVYNAARIQLSERAHELATLRVLGFSRGEVGYVLVGEILLLAVLAIPVGWGLGYVFARAINTGFSTDIISMPFDIRPRSFAIAAGLVLVTATGSAFWVRRRLDHVDLVSALKQKE